METVYVFKSVKIKKLYCANIMVKLVYSVLEN
jgi:hypothetical protein